MVFQFCCVLLALLAGIELLSVQGDKEDAGKTVADVVYVSCALRAATFVSWCSGEGGVGGVFILVFLLLIMFKSP